MSGPFRYKTFAADTLKRSIQFANKPMKQVVIAPSMLVPLYPLDVAFQKIASRVRGAKMAAEQLGIHVPAAA